MERSSGTIRGTRPATDLFASVVEKVRPYTMVTTDLLAELALQVQALLDYGVRGDLVECGVWRGGSSFLMAEVLRQVDVSDRTVWLFDSFEGLPPPADVDGAAALEYASQVQSGEHFDNCRVALEEVERTAAELGLARHTRFVKGWFEDTLPANRARVGCIALLRIDADWYSSVKCCLDNMYDQVVDGGLIVVDDYYVFDGCAKAVHDFLAERESIDRIGSIGDVGYQAAVLRKGGATWHDLRRLHLSRQEMEAVVPRDELVIFVDEEDVRHSIAVPNPTVPFVERDGEWWGAPEDSAHALRELDRLIDAGAAFIVFAWPAFWWLEHYAELHDHLRTTFRCVLDNERLVAFELRP